VSEDVGQTLANVPKDLVVPWTISAEQKQAIAALDAS
jgi:hypothetical protein